MSITKELVEWSLDNIIPTDAANLMARAAGIIRTQESLIIKLEVFLDNDIATLPCTSRQRDLPEEMWETAMYLRDLIHEARESIELIKGDLGENASRNYKKDLFREKK